DRRGPARGGPAPVDSSEPGDEVLPPHAVGALGRRLPKLLLVGNRREMFPTLAKAVAAALPGDIIEIRTKVPLVEAEAVARVKEKIRDAPLTIRAGKGYQPVLRTASGGPLLTCVNVDLKIVGIHFACTQPCSCIYVENSDATVSQCSF